MFCPTGPWRKCYLKGVLKHHPDKGGDADKFKMLSNCNAKMKK